ncbi:MAG: hypothetical protein KDA79_15855 [Planctomycetaceae bacterium]|nr:hypothetical protein [Planctomycetaceae bacterium]
MTEEEAIRKAREFVAESELQLGPVVAARYIDIACLDELAKDCAPDMLDTCLRVRKSFRNHWVVDFDLGDNKPGSVSSPATRMVIVYEDGEAEFSLSI